MFSNNPLLAQLKQKMQQDKPLVSGKVGIFSGVGFFYYTNEKQQVKYCLINQTELDKVFDGDEVKARVDLNNDSDVTFESIISSKTKFEGLVYRDKKGQLRFKTSDTTHLSDVKNPLKFKVDNHQWVNVKLIIHPLNNAKNNYKAVFEIISMEDPKNSFELQYKQQFLRHSLDYKPYPNDLILNQIKQGENNFSENRQNLTAVNFLTIDSKETEDMDDAIFIESYNFDNEKGENICGYRILAAIADPDYYIKDGTLLDLMARERAFSHYLPNIKLGMFPEYISNDLCSLRPNCVKNALVIELICDNDANLVKAPNFILATVESKSKLNYSDVSNYIEGNNYQENAWQPKDYEKNQLDLLHSFTLKRIEQQQQKGLVFAQKDEFRFKIEPENPLEKPLKINLVERNIANKMVEEVMVLVNQSSASWLKQQIELNPKIKSLFICQNGFKDINLSHFEYNLNYFFPEVYTELFTQDDFNFKNFTDFLTFKYKVKDINSKLLNYMQITNYDSTSYSTTAQQHFALGLDVYTTITSPLRKYTDLILHRVIKAIILQQPTYQFSSEVLDKLYSRRNSQRRIEKYSNQFLYCHYYHKLAPTNPLKAQVIMIFPNFALMRLQESGATAVLLLEDLQQNYPALSHNSKINSFTVDDDIIVKLGDDFTVKIKQIDFTLDNINVVLA